MHAADRQEMLNSQLDKQIVLLIQLISSVAQRHRADKPAVFFWQQGADLLTGKIVKPAGKTLQ